jgi:hypothetical protein
MKNALFATIGAALAIACSSMIQTGSQQSSIATTTLESLQAQFKFRERTATDGTAAKLPSRSVIPQSSVSALTTDGNGNLAAANVSLPAAADGATTISNGKMSVAVSARGAKRTSALTSGGSALYSNADMHGGHIVQTVIADGVETFVSFGASPSSDTIFDVSMNGVAGLRFVEGTVEFLDKAGAPRLRMSPPVLVDSAGVTADVTTTIEGCAYDDSPAGPWGRKVTAPGASSCAIHLSWSDAGLTYPVLLDPSWTTTNSMAIARRWHGAILLPTLKVLVIAGEGAAAAYLSSCELYDPSSGTWATTRSMSFARRRFTTVMVDGPKVLVAGGEVSAGRTATAALYNPTTGLWSTTGAMTSSRAYHDAVYLSSLSKVLVAGGMDNSGTVLSSAELYNPSSGTWSATGSMATARQNLSLTALQDQTALGVSTSSCDWFGRLTFFNKTYTFPLPGGIFGICAGSGSASGDANWFYPIGSNGFPECSSVCDQNLAGFHCWHDCVHANLDTDFGNQIAYPFSTFDSPGKPIFFLWHAWVDRLYGLRLDC